MRGILGNTVAKSHGIDDVCGSASPIQTRNGCQLKLADRRPTKRSSATSCLSWMRPTLLTAMWERVEAN
jgi:hypothetical protein